MKKTLFTSLIAAAVALPVVASAQFKKPDDAIEYRQAAFFLMGQHFGRLGAMAKGEIPFDAAQAKKDIAVFNAVQALPFDAFGAGTETGHHTKARPDVWKDSAKFDAARQKFLDAAPQLNADAAQSQDSLKKAVGAVGSTCKGCHDDFRAK